MNPLYDLMSEAIDTPRFAKRYGTRLRYTPKVVSRDSLLIKSPADMRPRGAGGSAPS